MSSNSALLGKNQSDIFYLREKMIKDIILKNSLDKIKNRPLNNKAYNISNTRPNIKPKNKTNKKNTESIILPKITDDNLNVTPTTSYKFLFSFENPNKNEYAKNYLDIKKKNYITKFIEIDKQNQKFSQRLNSINSPLNKNTLSNSYEKIKEYKNIAKKVRTNKEIEEIKNNKVKYHLPPIIFDRNYMNRNFENLLNLVEEDKSIVDILDYYLLN